MICIYIYTYYRLYIFQRHRFLHDPHISPSHLSPQALVIVQKLLLAASGQLSWTGTRRVHIPDPNSWMVYSEKSIDQWMIFRENPQKTSIYKMCSWMLDVSGCALKPPFLKPLMDRFMENRRISLVNTGGFVSAPTSASFGNLELSCMTGW